MRTNVNLVVSSQGRVRVYNRTNQTALMPNEIVMQARIEIPDSLFEKPILRADIKLTEENKPSYIIDAKLGENVQHFLKECGFNVEISVINPDGE